LKVQTARSIPSASRKLSRIFFLQDLDVQPVPFGRPNDLFEADMIGSRARGWGDICWDV